jgi:hypothetical protein
MEHREPPRIVAEDPRTHPAAPDVHGRLAPTPLSLPRPGRTALDRVRLRLVVRIALGLLGSYLVYRAGVAAVEWLGDQPAYEVPFRSIVLDPPPPPWYRGGSAEFLESVRRRARMPEKVPVLKLKPDELKQIFARSPWTEEVVRIGYPPRGVSIALRYRRPVAVVVTADLKKYLVDGSAVILPPEELDVDLDRFAKEQGLARIRGKGLIEPAITEPGIPWQPRAGVTDLAPGNDLIPSAARLASFLVDKTRAIRRAGEQTLDITDINPMDRAGRGLFIWDAESTCILWGQPPGEEEPASLTAEEKWAKLREWSRKEKARRIPEFDYWEIKAGGVEHIQGTPAPDSARVEKPARDGSAIRAKAAGQSR